MYNAMTPGPSPDKRMRKNLHGNKKQGRSEKRRLGSRNHAGQIRVFSSIPPRGRNRRFFSLALRASFLLFFLLGLLRSLAITLGERGFSWSWNSNLLRSRVKGRAETHEGPARQLLF